MRARIAVSGPTVVAIQIANGQAGWSVTKTAAAHANDNASHRSAMASTLRRRFGSFRILIRFPSFGWQ